jgi:glycosyltransferase involved in cell wall biosynthesis
VHNGVDTEEVLKKANTDEVIPEYLKEIQTLKIVFVGRLIHRKGLDLLLKAISVIHHQGERMNLIVVGDGDEKSVYLDMAEELGISEYVYFVGEQKNPFPFMKMADIFVLPSRSEGFPNVLLEAMAVGLPVIASNCETGPNEILNGKNGVLVKPDSSESLSVNLSKLLSNDILRSDFAAQARLTVKESFQLKNQLNRIEERILQAFYD